LAWHADGGFPAAGRLGGGPRIRRPSGSAARRFEDRWQAAAALGTGEFL